MSNKNQICAIIEEGCRFEGNLSFDGMVRVAGNITGSIFSLPVLKLENRPGLKEQ